MLIAPDFSPKQSQSEASASSSPWCLGKRSLAFDMNLLPSSDGEGDGELVDGHSSPCTVKQCWAHRDQEDLRERRNVGISELSCEDEDGVSVNRKKLRLSKQQTSFLEDSFRHHITLHPKQKDALAMQLNLKPRQIEVWFQNRRARMKLKQTEVEFEALKQRYQSLHNENRRLEKEVQHLRAAFKVGISSPQYMSLPAAATLTMCPSCQQVTPSSLHTHNLQEQRKSST